MEPIKGTETLMSNYEALALLQNVKSKGPGQQNLSTVAYEAVKYLKGTPCAQQSEEIIQKFMKAIAKYKLTPEEKLQLLNLRPSTETEMFVLIINCNERFSDEELAEILEVVTTHLPGPNVDDNDGAAAEGGN